MRHFNIHASKDNVTKIEIFGQIGDSFWEEGTTLESVRKEIESREDDLEVDIASLGGSAFEGLAIHDLFAMHKGKVIMNIVGATASAGAVIAESADEINISENSLFLIHNSHGIAIGNADDLESVADDMKKIDARMLSIFTKRAGDKKTEAEIKTLMDEDKFINAETAIEFGFVDKQIPVSKIAASVDMDKVMASKELTDIQKEQIKETLKSNNMATPEVKESTILTELKSGFDALKASIKAMKTPSEPEATEVKILDNAEVQAQITKMNDTLSTLADANETLEGEAVTAKEALGALTTEKEALDAEKLAWVEEKEAMQTELNTLKGVKVEAKEGDDVNPDTEDDNDEEGGFGNFLKAKIKARKRL